MNATSLISDLRARGVFLAAIGDRLRVDAPVGVVSPDLRAALAQHKPELVRLLSRPSDARRTALDGPYVETAHGYLAPGDLPDEWRDWYEERAAIREYHGGQAREHAEAEALRETRAAMRAADEKTGGAR